MNERVITCSFLGSRERWSLVFVGDLLLLRRRREAEADADSDADEYTEDDPRVDTEEGAEDDAEDDPGDQQCCEESLRAEPDDAGRLEERTEVLLRRIVDDIVDGDEVALVILRQHLGDGVELLREKLLELGTLLGREGAVVDGVLQALLGTVGVVLRRVGCGLADVLLHLADRVLRLRGGGGVGGLVADHGDLERSPFGDVELRAAVLGHVQVDGTRVVHCDSLIEGSCG